ncbi:hypothetical protein CEXT_211181 [Caerostris extrusa]|uniref:Uncharacterized protein n=1 Tax=Caerostris extrusa TaxID=172846 RepID=A0AAV4XXZ6_CAEEX|nr:hypothetical protein CEXT_211181 [Caerostris extrusa]
MVEQLCISDTYYHLSSSSSGRKGLDFVPKSIPEISPNQSPKITVKPFSKIARLVTGLFVPNSLLEILPNRSPTSPNSHKSFRKNRQSSYRSGNMPFA